MLDYYTIEEVAQKAGLNIDQVLRLGMCGTIIFAILEHKPRNFEEVHEYVDEEGRNVTRRRRNVSSTIMGNPNSGLQIKYISTEDVINTVTNEAANKKTLVSLLFETRELDPKKGKRMVNCPLSIAQNDLIIKAEEWELFERNGGKKLAEYLPLKHPEKVTIPWLVENVSVSVWVAAVGLAVSIFLAGIYVAETGLYKDIRNKVMTSNESEKTLNKKIQPTPDGDN